MTLEIKFKNKIENELKNMFKSHTIKGKFQFLKSKTKFNYKSRKFSSKIFDVLNLFGTDDEDKNLTDLEKPKELNLKN